MGAAVRLVVIVAVVWAATAARSPSYGAPTVNCVPPTGLLKVAPAGVTPLVWYDAANPPPPLTNQISEIAANLYPCSTGTMIAYVKNTASTAGVPSLAVSDLRGSTSLAGSIEVTITYTSSLRPSVAYTVATETLAALSAHGAYSAPVKLHPYSRKCPEIGTWTIVVGLPRGAGNDSRSQSCTCSVCFGIEGCSR